MRLPYAEPGYLPPETLQSRLDVKRVQAGLGLSQTGVWDAQTNTAYMQSRNNPTYTPVKNVYTVYNGSNEIDLTATIQAKIDQSRLTEKEKWRASIVLEELEPDGKQWLKEQIDQVGLAAIFSMESIEERLRKAFVEDTGFATELPRSAKETRRLAGLLREQIAAVEAQIAALPAWERTSALGAGGSARFAGLKREASGLRQELQALIEEGYQHGGLDEKAITIYDPHAPGGMDQIPFLGASSGLRLQTLLEDHDLLGGRMQGGTIMIKKRYVIFG